MMWAKFVDKLKFTAKCIRVRDPHDWFSIKTTQYTVSRELDSKKCKLEM